MPAHLDAPAAGEFFDPEEFRLCGWLWLESAHAQLATVEVTGNGEPIAVIAASALHERPDVTARFGLPPGTLTGFDVQAQVKSPRPDGKFELELRGRFSDGTHTPMLCARRLTPTPAKRHPFQMLLRQLRPNALGVEIGAHTNPAAALSPFYTGAVVDFAGTAGRVDFLADANALPLPDDTLDYLVSSHVLEHLPSPLGALHEWHRVLRPGGLLYLVVPDKRFTFDAPRTTTTVEHLLCDFQGGVNAADGARHVDEFVFHTDWSLLSPRTAPADIAPERSAASTRYLSELAAGRAIDIHYHTFTPDSLDALLRAAGFIGGESPSFALLAQAERYPPGRKDGIAFLLAKAPPLPDFQAVHRPRPFSFPEPFPASPRCRSSVPSRSSRCAPNPRRRGTARSSPPAPASATHSCPASPCSCRRRRRNQSGHGAIRAGVRLSHPHR